MIPFPTVGTRVETSERAIVCAPMQQPGTYVFEVVAIDDSGTASEPSRVSVRVAGV